MAQLTHLRLDQVSSGYGSRPVIDGVSIDVGSGEVVALIGRNGSGKSTVLKAAFGLLPVLRGKVTLDGLGIEHENPRARLRRGIAYLPQGRNVFGALTVDENLDLSYLSGMDKRAQEAARERVLGLLPTLRSILWHRAETLSGGQRQLVALGRTLSMNPRVLLLDEPSLGMSPSLVSWLLAHIKELSQTMKMAILIVEQRVHDVLSIADRAYVLRNGAISFSGIAKELTDDVKLQRHFF
ncbi:MAG: ABC transporter ATP-binding protein [Pseudomonadota bacterium]|nr:ABC transporter ATP-binding protein [Pseudomonadota bacterium]